MNWINLDLPSHISTIKKHSFDIPQMIFKHSTTCPISSMAKMRLEDKWDLDNITPYYLDLLSHRDLSNKIANVFEVHHESPQILLIQNGECIHDASHFDITVDEIKESLAYANKQSL